MKKIKPGKERNKEGRMLKILICELCVHIIQMENYFITYKLEIWPEKYKRLIAPSLVVRDL